MPILNPPVVPVPVPLAATLTSSNDDVSIYCVSLARTVTGAILPVTIGSTLYENTAFSSFCPISNRDPEPTCALANLSGIIWLVIVIPPRLLQ